MHFVCFHHLERVVLPLWSNFRSKPRPMAAAAGVICPEPTCCLVDDECEELLTVRFAEEPLSQTTIKAATALCHKHVLGVVCRSLATCSCGRVLHSWRPTCTADEASTSWQSFA